MSELILVGVSGEKEIPVVGAEGVTVTIPLFLTAAPHTKTAISLPELVRETNAFSKKYRPGCVPKLLDSNPKALFLHYNVKCNKQDSDPAGHDVRVQFDVTKVQESQKAKDLDVQISCSCPAFLYWGAQWNLHQRDGLLGPPRPKFVAPTERLDLRANFVICKHIHAVFERILPSVQHNIVNILREREVQRNKDKVRETPARLKKLQDELKRRNELKKIRETKDKAIRDKMVEALRNEEQARLMHEQELKNQGATPQGEPALEPEEEAVGRAVPEAALPAEEERDLKDIQDLARQEEGRIMELHEEGKPHVHKGLPYDIEPEEGEDKLMRKFESLHLSKLVRKEASPLSLLRHGTRVILRPELTLKGTVRKIKKPKNYSYGFEGRAPGDADVTVEWDDGTTTTVGNWALALDPTQRRLFAAADYPPLGDKYPKFRPGERVRHAWAASEAGSVVKQQRGGHWDGFVIVEWDDGKESRVNPLNLKQDESALGPPLQWEDVRPGARVYNLGSPHLQYTITDRNEFGHDSYAHVGVVNDEGHKMGIPIKDLGYVTPQTLRLFAAKADELAAGDTVWFASDAKKHGKVLAIHVNRKQPEASTATVDWSEVGLGVHDIPLSRLRTKQGEMF